MKGLLLVAFILPAVLLAQSQRQTTYVTTPDCFVQSFIPATGGGSLLAGYSRYASDSSLINLVFMNDSDEIVSHKVFNTSTDYDFVSHVIPVANGYLFGGKSSDTSLFHPQVIRTDVNGNVQWAKYFSNTSFWHSQILRIIPNGATFSMYTFAETPVNDIYRIEGDAGGNNFTGWKYMPDTAMSYRIFDAEPMVNSSSHILSGHANFNSTTTRGGMLMKTTTAGVEWCKQITAGGNFKNDILDVTAGSDGFSYGLFVCENMPGNQYSTIVLKFDSAGNKVWARQLELPGGTLNGSSIIESASNEFYVATYDNLFVTYLSKLDASGNLLWTRKWLPSLTSEASALKLFKDVNNNIVLTGMLDNSYFVVRLDANANGCGFTNTTAIIATTINPVIRNISFASTVFTPVTVNQPIVLSALAFTESMICTTGVGVNEEEANNLLEIYPNPAENQLTVSNWKYATSGATGSVLIVSIFNVHGKKILSTRFSSTASEPRSIDIHELPPGMYFVNLSDGKTVRRAKFLKQ